MRGKISCVLVLVFLALAAGCSSGHHNAVAPGLTQGGSADLDRGSAAKNHNIVWGLWDVRIDPLSGAVEIAPLRSAQWTLDMVKFLQPPAGPSGGIQIELIDNSEWLSAGRLQLDVSLTHPFPGLPQFTGADVRGVLVTGGHRTSDSDPAIRFSDSGQLDAVLANADGYTRWMNPVDFPSDGKVWTFTEGALGIGEGFDATINPFMYFADGLAPTDSLYGFFGDSDHLANRGQFTSGMINTRLYDLYFPLTGSGGKPEIEFQYAVLASWKQPVDLDPGDLPGSFPPDANTYEAFLMNAVDVGTLYYTPSQAGGDLILNLEIFDWTPYLTEAGTVVDEIERIIVESPQGILPAPFTEFDSSYIGANAMPGTTDASSVVPIEIANCLPTDVNGQQLLIAVEQTGKTYDNDGFGTNYPTAPLTAYFLQTLKVSSIIPQQDKPIVDAIDPNSGIENATLSGVTITGDFLSGVTELRLVGDTEQAVALNLAVVDDEHLTCDLDLTGLSVGLYDVVAHDPVAGDGSLVDGFEVLPATGVIVTSIDPDHGIPDTHIYDVMVTGNNFNGVTELKLVGDAQETVALNLQIIDNQNMECELDFAGLTIGLYDVVAHDPVLGDGVLPDGFEIVDCPGGIQDSFALYTTDQEFDPLFVAGLLTDGPYAGQVVTQKGMPDWDRLEVADPPANDTPVYFYASKPSISGLYNDWSWSMDMDPVNDVFAFATFDDDDDSGTWPDTQFDFVKVCNQSDGSYVGACDTNCGYIVAQVDFDEYGNVWAVCGNDYYPSANYTLQRWDFDPAAPEPHCTKVGEYDISAAITGEQVISDIVVLQRYRRLFISASSNGGPWGVEVHSWDFSTDPPTYLGEVFTTQTNFYGTNSFQEAHQRFVDMEVDRTDSVFAGCRIMVMYMGQPGVNRTLELRKYDVNMNVINSSSLEFNFEYDENCWYTYHYQMWFSNFVLDDLHGGRVVAIYDNFCMPAPGQIGVTNVPVDW